MIDLQKVDRSFGPVRAVQDVSFSVPRGAVVGVLGPNGAGKTTTIRMITGLLPPTRGRVLLDGVEVEPGQRTLRGTIGYLPEANPLPGEMSVRSYLRYRAHLFALPDRAGAVSNAIDRCQLGAVRRRRIEHLSKGFRQRVGLAAALLHKPPVLILDEPTSGLDPVQVAETRALIEGLAGEHTTLIVSHILPEVERTCDRLLIFAGGHLKAEGTRDDLLARQGPPSHTIEYRAIEGADPFADVPGATSTTTQALPEGWAQTSVQFRDDVADGGTRLGAIAAAKLLHVRALRVDRPTLESIYITLVEHEAAG